MHVNKTIDSWIIIRIGLVRTTVIISRGPFFSRSYGATILRSPVSFRNFAALRCSRTGAYVSGNRQMKGKLTPASIRPNQKAQRQPAEEMKPLAIGPSNGPKVVAWRVSWVEYTKVVHSILTAMKYAIVRPRILGSW